MSAGLKRLQVKNFRSLADLTVNLGPVNVFFGANGSGKSTILDTIWFFRDCAIRGVELASSTRSHGIGILWDGADEGEQIAITLATDEVEYQLRFGCSSGRIEPYPGERLYAFNAQNPRINRVVGSDKVQLFNAALRQHLDVNLREPEKLALGLYLGFNQEDEEVGALERALRFIRHYPSRWFLFDVLKKKGSDASYETRLSDRGQNAWSVLRNLHDRKSMDSHFDTIMGYMGESFPSFDGLRLEQTGPDSVYAYIREKGRRQEIHASGVSDGHLQLLLLLTALFSEGPIYPSVLLFDEPEISLHPHALAVFARAVNEAAQRWNKQILIATHSPVLLSQFEPDQVLATRVEDGQTRLTRLSEMADIKDLLQNYAIGSLYMAEVVGAQAQASLQPAED